MSGTVAGEPVDLDRIADALEGAGDRLAQRNQHLADLGTVVGGLAASTKVLIDAVNNNNRRNRNFRTTMVAIGVLAVVGIVATVVLLLNYRHLSVQNHQLATQNNVLAHQTQAIAGQIASCTTPGGGPDHGACLKRANATTTAAIVTLEQASARQIAAAIVCARTNTDFDHVLACVESAAGTK